MGNVSTFTEFLSNKGFKLVKEKNELGVVVYGENGFYVEIVKDMDGKHFIAVSRTNNDGWEGWSDMGFIRFLLLKQHFQKGGPTSFGELSQFFIEHYEEIRQAYSNTNIQNTEAALAKLKNERAKVLFGFEETQQKEEPQQEEKTRQVEKPSWLTRLLKTFGR